MEFALVAIVIVVALVFDYINGFHDAANSIATVVSTRVLSPGKAVIWAAFFNFAAAFVFGTAVAKTMGAGMIDIAAVTTLMSIILEPTVVATAGPKVNAATKLKKAAQMTALPGDNTRVDTTVAMELAASWKPLM